MPVLHCGGRERAEIARCCWSSTSSSSGCTRIPICLRRPWSSALRQCDGGRLQVILLVRDDFFASVNRLFRELEDPLLEGRNYALVDRFDRQHACKVLTAFGRAYGKLDDELSTSQEAIRFPSRRRAGRRGQSHQRATLLICRHDEDTSVDPQEPKRDGRCQRRGRDIPGRNIQWQGCPSDSSRTSSRDPASTQGTLARVGHGHQRGHAFGRFAATSLRLWLGPTSLR